MFCKGMHASLDDNDSDVSSINFGDDNERGFTSSSGFTSSDDEGSSVVEVHAHKKQKEGKNPEEEGEEETKKKTTKRKKTPKKTPKKKQKKTNEKSGGSKENRQTPAQAQRNTDVQLAVLLSLKVADMQYKNRMRDKEVERSNRKRLANHGTIGPTHPKSQQATHRLTQFSMLIPIL